MMELERTFDAPVVEAYGMTEASHQMTSNPLPPRARKPGTVGMPAGPEVAVMDGAGRPLPAGEVGEVVIRGPNVTRGYRDNPEADRAAFVDGWFRTGDEGRFDADGYLTITGQLKELINRGGEKVSPREVDEALVDHPAVAQVLAFAAPHAVLGEGGGRSRRAPTREFGDGRRAPRPRRAATGVLQGPDAVRLSRGDPSRADGQAPARGTGPRAGARPPGEGGREQRVGHAPRDGLEAALAGIWAEVLGMAPDRVGVNRGFLEMGGDSLAAVRVLGRVRDALGVEVTLVNLFAAPTVAGLAEAVRSALAALPDDAAERQLLGESEDGTATGPVR